MTSLPVPLNPLRGLIRGPQGAPGHTYPSFAAWLHRQSDRDDAVGDLARRYSWSGRRCTSAHIGEQISRTAPLAVRPLALKALDRAVVEYAA